MSYRDYAATRTVLATATDTTTTARGDIGDAPGQPQVMIATVDFGDGGDGAKTTVSNFTWRRIAITGDVARPTCRVVGRPSVDGIDDEDALLEGVVAVVTNIVDGVGFDVVAYAPQGSTGLFEVHIRGE